MRTPYLGVNKPSISVFKSFFIHKILVQQKNQKKFEKILKIQGFFSGFKTLFRSEQPLAFDFYVDVFTLWPS